MSTGQVLFKLDQRPFRIAVEEAKAQLASARLQVEAMKASCSILSQIGGALCGSFA